MRIEWFCLKISFPPNYEVFLTKKSEILKVGKLRKYDEKRVFFFEEKTFSCFKIASLPNWKGAKYAGGSRPSGLYSV